MKKGFVIILLCLGAAAGAYGLYEFSPLFARFRPPQYHPLSRLGSPELSGWIAWWEEEKGYALLSAYGQDFHIISPGWYEINDHFSLIEATSTADKASVIRTLQAEGRTVVPLIGTSLRLGALTPLFEPERQRAVIGQITDTAVALGVSGIDIDIEEVRAEDKDAYIAFMQELKERLREHGLKLEISIVAQTGNLDADGEGSRGIDLARVGQIADQVNILAYELNGDGTEAGPITTVPWLKQVMAHSLELIPKEKIVVGLPNYGYLWQGDSTSPEGYAYDEFIAAIDQNPRYRKVRDAESEELRYTAPNSEAWLSDSESIAAYMRTVQAFGVNRFSIWQLGGMDERLLQ